METIPEVPKCFGVFPPAPAAYLISLIGLCTGIFGLTTIVLYGLAEDSFLDHLIRDQREQDDEVKKVVLMTYGITCILLTVGSALVFIGMVFKEERAIALAGWIYFGMCMILIIVAIGVPTGCFFIEQLCIIKKVSAGEYVFTYIIITVFLWFWLYFMAVIFNYANGTV